MEKYALFLFAGEYKEGGLPCDATLPFHFHFISSHLTTSLQVAACPDGERQLAGCGGSAVGQGVTHGGAFPDVRDETDGAAVRSLFVGDDVAVLVFQHFLAQVGRGRDEKRGTRQGGRWVFSSVGGRRQSQMSLCQNVKNGSARIARAGARAGTGGNTRISRACRNAG